MYTVVEHEGIKELKPYPSNRFYNEQVPWEQHIAAIQDLRTELINYKSLLLYCVQGSAIIINISIDYYLLLILIIIIIIIIIIIFHVSLFFAESNKFIRAIFVKHFLFTVTLDIFKMCKLFSFLFLYSLYLRFICMF